MKHIQFDKVLISVMVAGCVLHPASSAFGLLILICHQVAERYFKANISDQDKHDLEALKADVSKLKLHHQASEIGKAFGAR